MAALLLGWLLGSPAAAADDSYRVIRLGIESRELDAVELLVTADRSIVLAADGQLHEIALGDPRFRRVAKSGPFRAVGQNDLRGELIEEFGRQFEVMATPHYLVVQPAGSGRRWPETFEQLHRTFGDYFAARGVPLRRGRFPMVAVVMPDEGSMRAYFDQHGISAPRVLGLYHLAQNRIVLYDHGSRAGGTAATVCHEAAHQSAYNWGIHNRVAPPPIWLAEGIACLFEAPQPVAGAAASPGPRRATAQGVSRRDWLHAEMLEKVRAAYRDPAALEADLRRIIRSDDAFLALGETGYALAWSVAFYLSERRPESLRTLLAHDASRPAFREYPAEQRQTDFSRWIGTEIDILGTELFHFLGTAGKEETLRK